VLCADVVNLREMRDVLAEVGSALPTVEAAQVIASAPEEIQSQASIALERLLRRLSPDGSRLPALQRAVRSELADAGLQEDLFQSVVSLLFRDVAARFADPSAPTAISDAPFQDIPEEVKTERREALQDRLSLLESSPRRENWATTCLELLDCGLSSGQYSRVLDVVEQELQRRAEVSSHFLASALETLQRHAAGGEGVDPAQRTRARELLWRLRGHAVLDDVVKALETARGTERQHLLLLLPQMGRAGRRHLLRLLVRAGSEEECRMLLEALARTPERSAEPDEPEEEEPEEQTPELRALLVDLSWPGVMPALSCLIERRDEFASRHLATVLLQGDNGLQLIVMDALQRTEWPEAPELIALGLSSSDPAVREHSARVLGQLGDQRSVLPLSRIAQRPNLFARYRRDQAAAMIALGQLRHSTLLPQLRTILSQPAVLWRTSNDRLRLAAAQALAALGTDEARAVLAQALQDRSPEIREVAQSAQEAQQ
jgi:HEAT repeat protein